MLSLKELGMVERNKCKSIKLSCLLYTLLFTLSSCSSQQRTVSVPSSVSLVETSQSLRKVLGESHQSLVSPLVSSSGANLTRQSIFSRSLVWEHISYLPSLLYSQASSLVSSRKEESDGLSTSSNTISNKEK